MSRPIEELEHWVADVIFGRARGIAATLTRLLMASLSWVFRLAVWLRLRRYRTGRKPQHYLGCQVIAIGNITVGGTGKTPVVELLAKTLRERGREVAILSRGYKSRRLDQPQRWVANDGTKVPSEHMPKVVSTGRALLLDSKYAGDEPFMLARNLDGVRVVVDKNRVKGGRFAIRHLGADTLILDDGMQYLDLAHSIDVVLVDAGAPFGTGWLLPRGTLREPPANLSRASYILLTKCSQAGNEELIQKIRRYNPTAGIVECTHGPIYLEDVFTRERQPLEALRGKWVGAISGIAVPEAFERSLTQLGAHVEVSRRFSDHCRFSRREVDQFMQRCVERDMEWILTTEKDAVRFPRPTSLDLPVFFLRIEVEILSGHDVWQDMVERIVTPPPVLNSVLRRRDAYLP